eukprot:NODE_7280_length_325_cov_93.927536_g6543_i0.p1 GENE.NODE_7280_length_325_cov_93.927536_g6543_i0~~NODE_7280_length_325_cov_93.927536_g6543_i0.p1  ORF type:complete len:72 (-),score=11.90 NODE_7280_length_325_cov_93.927536_g6543_i0:46-261(-)
MPVPRKISKKSDSFHGNITKRGLIASEDSKKKDKLPTGPLVLGILLFVVVGSALLQVIQNAKSHAGYGGDE